MNTPTEIPETMRYIDITAPGEPDALVLAEGPVPTPGDGEVLIRVDAAGVNRADIAQRKGHYPPPPGVSPILGMEVAGTIAACGTNSREWRLGDAVCALIGGGGYAGYCTAPAAQCLPVPSGFTMVEAAALPETFFTVWTNVFQRGRLAPGESLLVHGGSSGIGTTAIQLARHFGATVLTTAGSDEKCDACRRLGADLAVNYKTQYFVAEVKEFTEGRGVDVVLDMVGGPYLARNLDVLAVEGRLVQIAFLQGSSVELDLRPIMTKRLTVTGSTLRSRTVAEKGAIAAELWEKVWPILESRDIQPAIDRTFPLADASKAHTVMESSEHIGKIVLTTE